MTIGYNPQGALPPSQAKNRIAPVTPFTDFPVQLLITGVPRKAAACFLFCYIPGLKIVTFGKTSNLKFAVIYNQLSVTRGSQMIARVLKECA